jgi:hypothetical protein
LLEMAERSRIAVRVVPMSAGAHPGLDGPMLILDFPNEPAVVHVEVRGASGFIEEAELVRQARASWRAISSVALSEPDSVRLIESVVGGLKNGEPAGATAICS